MADAQDISEADIRQYLIERADAYTMRTKRSMSYIGEAAIRDSKFLANVKNGSNFTIKTYQRVLDWLDEEERAERAA